MKPCCKCTEAILDRDGIVCTKCSRMYHFYCGGISEASYSKLLPMNRAKWRCIPCKTQLSKAAVTQPEEQSAGASSSAPPAVALTPTGTRAPPLTTGSSVKHSPPAVNNLNPNAGQFKGNHSSNTEADAAKNSPRAIIDTATLIAYIDSKFEALKADWHVHLNQAVQNVETKLQSMTLTMNNYSQRLDELQSRMDSTLKSHETNLDEVNKKYDSLVTELEMYKEKYDEMEQVNRQCNIEIQNVPENKSENILNVVSHLSSAINIPIPMEQVRSAHRVRARVHSDRPRNIVVQLNTRRLRDDIIAAARVRRGLTTESLQIAGPSQRVYVNEHLTLRNKILYAKARKLQIDKQYEFAWVKNGNIFVRKTAGARSLLIKKDADLLKM